MKPVEDARCSMVFAMFSTTYYNIARKRDATASDGGR